ncbi:hypothetical protein ECANGB1_2204 [Enterospora canceri]|uniref:Uncharacterized protein n=1 Tax=Enterospora canceri TaxID=1081671 RepID=A0A1Y1S4X3_9MICR|nr:hypothetical protein ECANGB1_2204 [Enterospora canceri]
MLQHELDLIKPEEMKYQFLEFNRIIKEAMDIAQPELNDRICNYFKLLKIVSLESTCLMIK